jgi:hypothetical protein
MKKAHMAGESVTYEQYTFRAGKPEGEDCLGDKGVNGKIILKNL